ncbi:fluoride efflux transporter CrcB [Halobacillus halophilus]|uniref:fluoride efflux transporter CrcB n=1 Tax=Halobacillus halophilus TaxID=1570 RepID=UPI001CD3218C|nr:fluoride efflux transporter CrcB [Halobacillus halophilus]MCA1011122.1 fluoride efflux transporter CrcB [Halobacillus halophilus]
MNALLVFFGGMMGAVARFEVSTRLNGKSDYPLGTAAANITGGLLLGILFRLQEIVGLSDGLWLLLAAGFCGGYTTYSTFSYEVFYLIEKGQWMKGLVYAGTSLILTVAGLLLILFI